MIQERPVIGIIDANPRWVVATRESLRRVGYLVAPDDQTMTLLRRDALNLLLLDVGSEPLNPQTELTSIRSFSRLPLIALGHIDNPAYKASILDAGADDYLVRDGLDPRELLARVRAQLRRPNRSVNRRGYGYLMPDYNPPEVDNPKR